MTREEVFASCLQKVEHNKCLLLELATGFGKSKLAIDLVNHLSDTVFQGKEVKMLLLVAKRVHKQTWKDEFQKWGGIKANVIAECYESLHKHTGETFDIVVADEVHHIGSEERMRMLKSMKYSYMIGLSATIPLKLKWWFNTNYHSEIITCNVVGAIDSEILPEPTILLWPLEAENTRVSETIEVNPKVKGQIYYGEYKEMWKCKKQKVHAILKCTQKQKLIELDKMIDWAKGKAMSNPVMKQTWLYMCGKRLEFFADCKLPIIKLILHHLDKERTITFCKTIEQTEKLGSNCIHSKNKDATIIYDSFNQKRINHIAAVNILNENANLVDCKYAIFTNLSSSETIQVQRIGRSLRHKSPVIVLPYYKGTREEEIVQGMVEGFNKKCIKTIHSIQEIL